MRCATEPSDPSSSTRNSTLPWPCARGATDDHLPCASAVTVASGWLSAYRCSVAFGVAWPDSISSPLSLYSAVSSERLPLRAFGVCNACAGSLPLPGSNTATVPWPGALGVGVATASATVSADLVLVPVCGSVASSVNRRSPGAIGAVGTSTHSPRSLAVTSPSALSPSSTVTLASGAARPAITAWPVGSTLTMSKLGAVGAGSGAAGDGRLACGAGAGGAAGLGGVALLVHKTKATPAIASVTPPSPINRRRTVSP